MPNNSKGQNLKEFSYGYLEEEKIWKVKGQIRKQLEMNERPFIHDV